MIDTIANAFAVADDVPLVTRHDNLNRCYDVLWQRLRQAGLLDATGRGVVGLTSCQPGSGSSTIAANMAIRAARSFDGGVLLVDADVRNHALAPLFRVPQSPGLVQAMRDDARPLDCVQATTITNLAVMAAGSELDAAATLFDTARLGDLIEQLQQDFELIVFDLPIADESTHCLQAASVLDGVLLVIESQRIDRELATRAKRKLLAAKANVLGVVINKEEIARQ